jgi:hypothetical protein
MEEENDVSMGDAPLDPNIGNFPNMSAEDQKSYVRYMILTNKFDQFEKHFSSLEESQHAMRAALLKAAIRSENNRDSQEVQTQKNNAAITRWSGVQGGKKRKSRRRKQRKTMKRKHSRRH